MPAPRKLVLVGTGFLATHTAHALARLPNTQILLASRSPSSLHAELSSLPSLLPPANIDITQSSALGPAFEGASCIVNLVGLLVASPEQFEAVQHKGAENVAAAARKVGASLVHVSAIGADPESNVSYWRTKGLGEKAVRDTLGDRATIIRPSLVFGPGDSFFNRFAKLAKYMPFLPVFGGGTARFQPVYVGDIARAIAICAQRSVNPDIEAAVAGRTFEAGGPDVLTYRELMRLTLLHSHQARPILSLPFTLGKLQASILERLPSTLFTVTRDQIEQLKYDNVVREPGFAELLEKFGSVEDGGGKLKSVHEVLPTYL